MTAQLSFTSIEEASAHHLNEIQTEVNMNGNATITTKGIGSSNEDTKRVM